MLGLREAVSDAVSNAGNESVGEFLGKFDRNGDRMLSKREFTYVVRYGCSVPVSRYTDQEILLLFKTLSGIGGVSLDAFEEWVRTGKTPQKRGREGSERTRTSARRKATRKKLGNAESLIKSRLRAASYSTGGVNWPRLFAHYDRDNSGHIEFNEFRSLMRRDAKIPASNMSDRTLRKIFEAIDTDGSTHICVKEFTEWLDGTSPTTPEKPQPARRSPNLNQKPRVDDHLEADIEKLLPKSPVPALTVADEPVENSAAPASAPTTVGISPSPETREPGLGIGTAEDANATIDWIHSLQHVGDTTTARVTEPAFAAAAAAIPASSPQDPPPAIPMYDTSTPITALYRVSQSDLGTLLKHSEAPRLRFWIRKLREELIREAAWNRKSNAEIASLRRLVDSQQRELMDSRVQVAHLEASLDRVRREHEHLSQVQHLAEQAIRMAGKARIDSESERDSHTAEITRLLEENKALREKLAAADIDNSPDEQLQPAQEDEML